jgi:hypothetical protein
LANVPLPMANAIPLAKKLTQYLRDQVSGKQLTHLDQMHRHLTMMQRVDSEVMGRERFSNTFEKHRLVSYFRWEVEQSLTAFFRSLSDKEVVELDLRGKTATHHVEAPLEIGRHQHFLLMRVFGEETAEPNRIAGCTVASWDLVNERPDSHFSFPVHSQGTTYVLLDLNQLPNEQTIAYFDLRDADSQELISTHSITLQAPRRGQLRINVVNAQEQPIPVLMSITSIDGGRLWEPAEAIDLRDVLNDIVPHLGTTGRGYMFHLFGQRRGRYWIVKPPLEMPLPEGQWQVKILRGLEYKPISMEVRIQANEWTRLTLKPKRWTDMTAVGWYSGDDHVHARLQTSEDARKLLDYTRAVDINVANILEMGDVMRTYYSQRGFGKEYRVHLGDHWLVPGQEDPRSVLGHAIGLNLQSKVRDLDRYLSNDWVAAEIHRQGGLYGHTHVGPNACFVHREMSLFTPHGIVDFNSIMQATLGTELYYDFLNLGFKMTASAGADTPYGGTIGAVRTYAYTGKPDAFSPDDWFDAVKAGRTFVSNGPMLDLRVNEALPGDEVVVDFDDELQVSVRAWGDAGWSAPQELKLVKLGETIETVTGENENQTELSLSTTLKGEHGFWLAAHAIAHDGSQAHSTPVYVTHQGFRHWNIEKAGPLIEQQLATLREIEAEVVKAENVQSSGNAPLDYWTRRTAEQADAVREMVAKTRRIYAELQKQLIHEESLRH